MNFRYCKILNFFLHFESFECTGIILENPTLNSTSLDIKEKLTISVRFSWVKKNLLFSKRTITIFKRISNNLQVPYPYKYNSIQKGKWGGELTRHVPKLMGNWAKMVEKALAMIFIFHCKLRHYMQYHRPMGGDIYSEK